MATKNGWWSFSTNVEPSKLDLEHIAELIKQGFTSGEIIKDGEEITELICPNCESENVEYFSSLPMGITVYRCNNCRSTFNK